jgi:hypothetical protein
MDGITIAFAVLAALVVFAIAAVAVGREAHRLDAIAPRVVYELDEAVDFVCDRLPPESQARLTPEEVEQLLIFHMQWLHAQGLQPEDILDRRQDIADPVVITEDDLTAYLLGESDRVGIYIVDDVDAVNVVNAHLEYMDVIGAIGPEAGLDDVI